MKRIYAIPEEQNRGRQDRENGGDRAGVVDSVFVFIARSKRRGTATKPNTKTKSEKME